MIELFSTEFWIAILFLINFFLVIFLFAVVKKVNGLALPEPADREDEDTDPAREAKKSGLDIIALLNPLVKDSRKTADRFEAQIKEKKQILKRLNQALDSRIININLLLSRAETVQKKLEQDQVKAYNTAVQSAGTAAAPETAGLNAAGLNIAGPGNAVGAFDQQNRIIEMYNQNCDVETIAKQLAVPVGEVSLVIDLKKKFIEMENNSR